MVVACGCPEGRDATPGAPREEGTRDAALCFSEGGRRWRGHSESRWRPPAIANFRERRAIFLRLTRGANCGFIMRTGRARHLLVLGRCTRKSDMSSQEFLVGTLAGKS